MKKIINYKQSFSLNKLQIIKVLLCSSLSFFILHNLSFIISAQEPATQSSSLIQKIDTIKQEIASKAAALKTEVSKSMSNKAILGQISLIDSIDKNSNKITMQPRTGNSQVVLTDQYTVIQGPGLKPNTTKVIDVKDLNTSDMIVALGDLDDKNNLVAKKVVKLDKYVPDAKLTILGDVESIDGDKIVMKKKDGSSITLQTSKETLYKVGNDDADAYELAANRPIIIVGIEKSDQTIETRFIYMAGTLDPSKKEKLQLSSPSPSAKVKK